MEDLFRQTVYLRMGERVALTAIIVLLALIVTAGFWKSMQRVEFRADKSVGLGGNFVLATPVFVLLALVGYAWVTLNAPVSFVPGSVPGATAPSDGDQLTDLSSGGEFTAVVESALDHRRSVVLTQIRGLNCLFQQANRVGPIGPAQFDALASAKLDLMEPVWDPEWGDFLLLNDWAMGFSDSPPLSLGQTYFEDTLPEC